MRDMSGSLSEDTPQARLHMSYCVFGKHIPDFDAAQENEENLDLSPPEAPQGSKYNTKERCD